MTSTRHASTASNSDSRSGGGAWRAQRRSRSRSASREGWSLLVPSPPLQPLSTPADIADAIRARRSALAKLKARRRARNLKWTTTTFKRMQDAAARNIAAAWRGHVARREATRRRLAFAAAEANNSRPGRGDDNGLNDGPGNAQQVASSSNRNSPLPTSEPPAAAPSSNPLQKAASLIVSSRTLLLDGGGHANLGGGNGQGVPRAALDITNELFRFVLLALQGSFGPAVHGEAGRFVSALEGRLRAGACCCIVSNVGAVGVEGGKASGHSTYRCSDAYGAHAPATGPFVPSSGAAAAAFLPLAARAVPPI